MAAATEDRLDVFSRQLRHSLDHDFPVANPETDQFFESTLVQLDANEEAVPLAHAAGDDDSGVQVFANMTFQDDEPFTGKFQRDRAGTDPLVNVYSGVILEFETNDAIGNYTIGATVYGVDNQTVDSSQADGSSGNRPEVGRVYDINDQKGTVKVYVPGILG